MEVQKRSYIKEETFFSFQMFTNSNLYISIRIRQINTINQIFITAIAFKCREDEEKQTQVKHGETEQNMVYSVVLNILLDEAWRSPYATVNQIEVN